MKNIILFLSLVLTLNFACSDEESPDNDPNCGKEVVSLCYAHNWDEFAMLKDFDDGKATYNHRVIVGPDLIAYYYEAKLNVYCNTTNLKVDFTNTVKLNAVVQYEAQVIFNNAATPVTLNNVNGIITGTYNRKLDIKTPTTIEIVSIIIVHNPEPNDSEKWYNENISSHGYTTTFQLPK